MNFKFLISNFQFLIVFLLLVTCYLSLVTPAQAQNTEENATNNMQRLTRPDGITIVQPGNPDFFQTVINFFTGVGSTFNTLFFNTADLFKDKPDLYHDSILLNSTSIPPQLTPNSSDLVDNLSHSLGEKGSPQVGFYALGLPNFDEQPKAAVKDYECEYEKVNFPEGIHPITGQAELCVPK